MLVKILVGVAVALAVFVVVVATRPTAYHVERRLEVAAPPGVVFGVLDDVRQFAGVLVMFGSPWETIDPAMRKTIGGPAVGAGQSYEWKSGKELGTGRMTIVESVPGRKVGVKIEFVAPMQSTTNCALTLADAPAGTLVTWSMAGNHNFIGKAMGLFMDMDKMLGADLEMGLVRLKAAAEAKQAAVAPAAQADAASPKTP